MKVTFLLISCACAAISAFRIASTISDEEVKFIHAMNTQPIFPTLYMTARPKAFKRRARRHVIHGSGCAKDQIWVLNACMTCKEYERRTEEDCPVKN